MIVVIIQVPPEAILPVVLMLPLNYSAHQGSHPLLQFLHRPNSSDLQHFQYLGYSSHSSVNDKYTRITNFGSFCIYYFVYIFSFFMETPTGDSGLSDQWFNTRARTPMQLPAPSYRNVPSSAGGTNRVRHMLDLCSNPLYYLPTPIVVYFNCWLSKLVL